MPEVPRRRVREEEPEDDTGELVQRPRDRVAKAEREMTTRDDKPDDDVYVDEGEAPRRHRTTDRRPPPGIRTGLAGARETSRTGGQTLPRMQLSSEPQLIVVLGADEPFASFGQHWVASQESGRDRRPYTCIGRDCPLCAMGDRPGKQYLFNVLLVSAPDRPENKVLQIGKKAFDSFEETATDRSGETHFDRDFWAVSRTGRDQRTYQTNFRPVKARDLQDDWPDVSEKFDVKDLEEIITEAKDNLFGWEVVESTPKRELEAVARYLADED